MTPSAVAALVHHWITEQIIARHVVGDFGDLSEENKAINERAIAEGGDILSVYHLRDGTKLYIITDAGRMGTTIICADEY